MQREQFTTEAETGIRTNFIGCQKKERQKYIRLTLIFPTFENDKFFGFFLPSSFEIKDRLSCVHTTVFHVSKDV